MSRLRMLMSVAGAAALLVAATALAGGPPYGIPSGVLSSDWGKYRAEYQQMYHGVRPAHPNPAEVAERPNTSYLHIYHARVKHQADNANQVVLMAHVPVDASVWLDGTRMPQTGDVRFFETPALEPGYNYFYTVRVVWNENGKWVSDSQKVTMRAGDVVCVDLRPASDKELAATVAANLAKLNPSDRKLAEEQRFCAVQNGKRLGEMGVPDKIMVNGQPVFLCCNGCEKTAQSNPERTLAKVAELRAKATTAAH